MQTRDAHPSIDGAVGGLLAGLTVMLWFGVLDVIAGQPLATPRLLSAEFLHQSNLEVTAAMLAGYTVLHLGAFAVLGAGAALFLRAVESPPRVVYGFLFGVLVLDAAHFGPLLAVNAEVMTLLPAVHVTLANIVGGVVLMGYLHRVQHAQSAFGFGALKHHPVLAEGLLVGTIGALAVAVWFLVLDSLMGRPMFTPAALGSVLFLGASSAAAVQVSLGTVAAYTALHVAAFLAVGVLFVLVAKSVEHMPGLWLGTVMGFIVVEAGFIGVAGSLANWVLGALGLWAIGVGNIVAVGLMGWRIWTTRPELRERLAHRPVATMV